jgi:hypothetical protein
MALFTKISRFYKYMTPKQFMLAGVFMLALAGAIGGGFASKQLSTAAVIRDCSTNSIDLKDMNGGCGAATNFELAEDIRDGNPSDLNTIYSHFGLTPAQHQNFTDNAQPGVAYQNGDIVVDGQVVIKNAWSIGRSPFSYSTSYPIAGAGNTYKSMHTKVLKQTLPVMVMFDDNGTAQYFVMHACGNPGNGDKVPSTFECKTLNKVAVAGKENTYDFTTTIGMSGLAKVAKFEYFVDGKLVATKSSASDAVRLSFDKDATVSVKVTFTLPGKKTKVVTSVDCSKQVVVKKKEFTHVCKALVATSSDNKTFRFTVQTEQTQGVTVKNADFTLDGNSTTTGVATKDNGNIYRDYTFADAGTHTVSIKQITFVVEGKDVVVTTPVGICKSSVTREKAPECKPGIPQGDIRCTDYCKPGIPVGDVRCTECRPGVQNGSKDCEMPVTGPAGTAGLFVGVSAFGAAAHRLVMHRRNRRAQ